MTYTEEQKKALFSFDEYDESEAVYKNLLDQLNTEFRTFGEGLNDVMESKSSEVVSDPIAYLKNACTATGVPISDIGSINTLKNWFNNGIRPKKGAQSRSQMFAFAFAMRLTESETVYLFHKVYLDRAFNHRDYTELIYYYCIRNGMTYSQAKMLIAKVHLDDSPAEDRTVYTAYLAEQVAEMSDTSELLAFIQSNGHNFAATNVTLREAVGKKKKEALQIAAAQVSVLREAKKNGSMQYEQYRGQDLSSDSFLYSFILDQSVAGERGTTVLPFKSSAFPTEIKNNFPQAKSLALSASESSEELRKTLILLFSFVFWARAQEQQLDDTFGDYQAELNVVLHDAGVAELYYGNPFDWLFLYCANQTMPLDTFRGIIAGVLYE